MGWWGPYPGRGPWRHLPPPLRPGWWARGWCWWWPANYPPAGPYLPPVTKEEEVRYLMNLKNYLEERLKEVEARLKVLEGAGK